MSVTKLYQLGISMLILTIVALIGERHRDIAGLLSAMPLTIPLSIWIVYSNTGGNLQQTSEFARAAFFGIIPTGVFCLAVWLSISKGMNLPKVYFLAYGIWFVLALCSYKLLPR